MDSSLSAADLGADPAGECHARSAIPAWAAWALDQPRQARRVTVAGASINVLCWSDGDVAKPPLLLVHGHRAHARWWDVVAPYLAATHRVHALDLSGMGDSEHRASYPAGFAARDIAGVIRELGLGPATVIGHSNGGVRALKAAGDAPELFHRLIVIDSYAAFEGTIPPGDPPRLRGDRTYPDRESALSRYRLLPEQPHAEAWAVDHVAGHSVREVADGWRWKFDAAMPVGLTSDDHALTLLPAVRCPVHYVYGGASAIVSPSLARRIVATLPRGHGPIVIPGGHHHLMFDQPQALIATLQALLSCPAECGE